MSVSEARGPEGQTACGSEVKQVRGGQGGGGGEGGGDLLGGLGGEGGGGVDSEQDEPGSCGMGRDNRAQNQGESMD